MVSNEEIEHGLRLWKRKVEESKTPSRDYLFCDNCDSYHNLNPEESFDDFNVCHCGGTLSKMTYSYSNLRARNELLHGKARMLIQIPTRAYSGGERAVATLGLGLVGFAATGSNNTTKNVIVDVQVIKTRLVISGILDTEIDIFDISNTFLLRFSTLTMKFKDGSSIVLRSDIYSEALNDILRARAHLDINPEIVKSEDEKSFFKAIKEAKELLDMGAITPEEFEQIKLKYIAKFK